MSATPVTQPQHVKRGRPQPPRPRKCGVSRPLIPGAIRASLIEPRPHRDSRPAERACEAHAYRDRAVVVKAVGSDHSLAARLSIDRLRGQPFLERRIHACLPARTAGAQSPYKLLIQAYGDLTIA